MKSRRHHRWISLLPLATLSLLGCQMGMKAEILPSESDNNVPVNAVIRVRYVGKEFIRPTEIRPENFELSEYSSDSGAAAAPAEPTEKEEGSGAKPSPTPVDTQRSTSSEKSIEGRVIHRRFKIHRKYDDGREEDLARTDVFFIPFPSTIEHPPLKEKTQYHFTAHDVRDMQGNIVLGAESSFTTVESSSFDFRIADRLEWRAPRELDSPTLATSDVLLVRFNDGYALPTEVNGGLILCDFGPTTSVGVPLATSDSSEKCGRGGMRQPGKISLIEALDENQDHYVTASYRTYAIGGALESDTRYRVAASLGEDPVSVSPPITFNVDNGEATDRLSFYRKVLGGTPETIYAEIPLTEPRRR